jgi:hypothetical protein
LLKVETGSAGRVVMRHLMMTTNKPGDDMKQNTALINKMQSAINKLNSACADLDDCDSMVNTDDFKYYRSQIKDLLSCDHGEAGLIPLLNRLEMHNG